MSRDNFISIGCVLLPTLIPTHSLFEKRHQPIPFKCDQSDLLNSTVQCTCISCSWNCRTAAWTDAGLFCSICGLGTTHTSTQI